MKAAFDLIGIGIGPFNLSLAALLSNKHGIKSLFLEKKKNFTWHSEVLFRDSVMQTSYLKDLVTPIDPTNPHSFLNYLVEHGLFYAHLNTGRAQVSRKEFELYCQWVSRRLDGQLVFNSTVEDIKFQNKLFKITTSNETFWAKNICIGTGLTPWVPDFAKSYLSETCFHAKSDQLAKIDLNGKRVSIIGGGQTGLEVFRNAYNGLWGQATSVNLISRRHTLEPLDDSPFTNEYFTPNYTESFYDIDPTKKRSIIDHQKLASDGNTGNYLQETYNEIFRLKHIDKINHDISIFPMRIINQLEKTTSGYQLTLQNNFNQREEKIEADVIIFCTGFRNLIPDCLNEIKSLINFDEQNCFRIDPNFAVNWQHSDTNTIYAMNFGRQTLGIAEPQTSLMAWRSGKIINHLMKSEIYTHLKGVDNFTQYGIIKNA